MRANDHGPILGHITEGLGDPPFEDFTGRVQELWKSLEPFRLWKKTFRRTPIFKNPLGRLARCGRVLKRHLKRWNQKPPCEVEQLMGGSYNRVIGINIPETYETSSDIDRSFILRIPRENDARPDRYMAILNYVRNFSSIPVPEVVHTDYTADNPLGYPYVIQTRVPGRSLASIWDPDLSVEQRCSVALDLAKMLGKLQKVTGPGPGMIEAHERVAKGLLRTTILPYELQTNHGVVDDAEIYPQYTGNDPSLFDFFMSQINRWRALLLAPPKAERRHDWREQWECWRRVIVAAEEMNMMGLLRDNTYSLCHLDLYARNIMAEIQDDSTVKITGYVDWDSAIFAPSFVGCAPPFWLWYEDPAYFHEENERGAACEPKDPANLKVKQVFDDAVGRDFLHFAYEPRFRLARMLFRIAKDGIWHDGRIRDAVNFVDDWYDLRKLMLSEDEVARLYW